MTAIAKPTERVCSKCGRTKPLAEFYPDRSKGAGHRPDCKSCVKDRNRAFYRANAERLRPAKRAQMRRWRRGVVSP
jgi:hypothetical protein